ncbi:hypothetical protein DH2020_049133 [Rehmannia glutinosa]|uniref:MBD domain-containing protein n=1 Tax=Rehmannia glutinosa TaxID=99300 RepID=A0ABR0U3L5_REHGL
MVVGKSPEWLPSGFTEKVKYKDGKKIKYYYNDATGAKYHSKKDVLSCATSDNGLVTTPQTSNGDDNVISSVATGAIYQPKKYVLRSGTADQGLLGTPQPSNGDDNGLSSNNKIDATLVKTNDSPKCLPDGWIVEEKTRQSGSSRGSIYKVYTDVSSGSKFYSWAAVTRYLNTLDRANTSTVQTKHDNVEEPSPPGKKDGNTFKTLDKVDEPSPHCLSITNTGGIPEEKKDDNSFKTLDNVDEQSPHMSPQRLSMTNEGGIPKEKKKGSSFKTVATVSTAADDDLPPGWIKEIITSKSGNKIRKDPFYTDPISGYIFRSKLDALRYLKTNDISSCACRPKKKESDDLSLIKNEIPSSNPAPEKLSEQKQQLFVGGESDGCGENSGTKSQPDSETKISKQTQGDNDADSVKVTSDPLTKQQPSECGTEKQTDKTPKNPKKRKVLSLPSRTSKRLAKSEPELPSNSVISERSVRAAAKRPSGSEVDVSLKAEASMPPPSGIEPAEEASEREFVREETIQEIEPPKEPEKAPNENPAIPDEQTGGNSSEKQVADSKRSQESQLFFDFGDSWSDPLEFALKTLRGEIPIDDTLAFQGCFSENLNIPYNNHVDSHSKPSQSDVPNIFQTEVAPNSGPSNQNGAVNQPPPNPTSFSALGNIGFPGFSGFNSQPSTEVGKKDFLTKFNP